MLHEETDTLQNQLDEKNAALAKAEKDRDAANGGKETAEKALTDYKAQQTQKDTHAAKEAKFRELLKSAGVLDKYADRVVRLARISTSWSWTIRARSRTPRSTPTA